MSAPTLGLSSYLANCHCGAVTFTVRTESLAHNKVSVCNCSICSRNGYRLVYPERSDVNFHSGFDHMVSYFFGDKVGAHKFCPTCGSSVIVDFKGDANVCVNVRLIQDIDLKALKHRYINGKAMKPGYKAPTITSGFDPSITSASGSELTPYNANCHCGAVTYTVLVPSLADHKVTSCNCSICSRNGYLSVYPKRTDVIFHTGYDRLSTYSFGSKTVVHRFCPTCGSSILVDGAEGSDQLAMNVRMFQDIKLRELKLQYGKTWSQRL